MSDSVEGTVLEGAPCPHCGAALAGVEAFCPHCGLPVGDRHDEDAPFVDAATGEAAERRRLTRKERRAQKRSYERRRRAAIAENRKAARERRKQAGARGTGRKARARLSHDDELWKKNDKDRRRRAKARDVAAFVGFDYMAEDGTCQVEPGLFSQTVAFSDISYQASRTEDQKVMFNLYSQVFNYCGADTCLELNVVNTPLPAEEIGNKVFYSTEDPRLEAYVEEYNAILNDKMRDGISNLRRERYLTYAVGAATYAEARQQLARVRDGLTAALQKLGCSTRQLRGIERLELLSSQLRPGRPLEFEYGDLLASGLTSKDSVCPSTIDFKPDGRTEAFRADGKWFQVLSFRQFGSQITDDALASIINLPIPLDVALHVQAIDQSKAKDYIRKRLAWIDKDIIEYQRKAIKSGYSPDLLPQEMSFSKNEAEELLDEVQYKNQRLFLFSGVVMTYAESYEELQEQVLQIMSTARSVSLYVDVLDCQQKQGLNTALPLASNHMLTSRYLTSAQVAILLPFATQEINHPHGAYAGQNKLSSNLIFLDRAGRLTTPSGFVFGMSGSGKSFAVKREIFNQVVMHPDDVVFIVDPQSEYPLLVEALGGQVVDLSGSSPDHINVLDLFAGAERVTGEDPARFKTETLMALASEVVGSGSAALTAEERTYIDRALKTTYARFADSDRAPVLGDFYEDLKRIEQAGEPTAHRLVTAFELYVDGSLNFFNHGTNVDLGTHVTSFSFRNLGANMRVFAMLVILDFVYQQMLANFERGVRTWLYIDEVQSLFGNDAIVSYFDTFWSTGRKFNLVATGITQTVARVIDHPIAKHLLSNSDYLLLLKQDDRDRERLAELLGLSDQQASYMDRTIAPGEGLLVAGGSVVPFKDDFPKGPLYDLWNTKPDEIAEQKRARWMRDGGQAGSR